MSGDVSKPGWPFMSTLHAHPRKSALPLISDALDHRSTPMPDDTAALDDIRARAFELLAREGRPMHTGELAAQLQLKTHEIHTAMHHPHQVGKVRFMSSEGWSLPPAPDKARDDKQERLA